MVGTKLIAGYFKFQIENGDFEFWEAYKPLMRLGVERFRVEATIRQRDNCLSVESLRGLEFRGLGGVPDNPRFAWRQRDNCPESFRGRQPAALRQRQRDNFFSFCL